MDGRLVAVTMPPASANDKHTHYSGHLYNTIQGIGPIIKLIENNKKPNANSTVGVSPELRRLYQIFDQLVIEKGALWRHNISKVVN